MMVFMSKWKQQIYYITEEQQDENQVTIFETGFSNGACTQKPEALLVEA